MRNQHSHTCGMTRPALVLVMLTVLSLFSCSEKDDELPATKKENYLVTLNLNLSDTDPMGKTRNMSGDPGYKEEFLSPVNIYAYLYLPTKKKYYVKQQTVGDDWWTDTDNDKIFDGKEKITFKIDEEPPVEVQPFVIISRETINKGYLGSSDLSFSSGGPLDAATNLLTATIDLPNTDDATLKNLFSAYAPKPQEYTGKELNFPLMCKHVAARMDFQWDTDTYEGRYVKKFTISGLRQNGVLVFNPTMNTALSKGDSHYSREITTDLSSRFTGREYFYAIQNSASGSFPVSVNAEFSDTNKEATVTFTPASGDGESISWLLGRLKF